VGARVLQGVAAAVLVPASLALVQASSDSSAGRARAVGAWGAVAGIAAASGPVIGGALSSAVSWRVVFFVNVPIGLAALALMPGVRDAPRHPARRLDLAGQLLAVVALAALTVALIGTSPRRSPSRRWPPSRSSPSSAACPNRCCRSTCCARRASRAGR
jgi:DHA2 family methylenomycin A resistance protein-like MFS transporter